MAELYFQQNVDDGLKELDEGKGVSHEEAKKRLNRWLKYTLFISQRIYK
jgi:predicted transcriptional regulator